MLNAELYQVNYEFIFMFLVVEWGLFLFLQPEFDKYLK